MKVPTVTVRMRESDQVVIINADDFDESLHEHWRARGL